MGTERVSLTTNELAAVLVLCGYENMASQVLNSLDITEGSGDLYRFIEETENSLKAKGFLDENRGTVLTEGLESLLHILVQSKRKIRCIKKDRVLFIHFIKGDERVLIQEIRHNTHFFSIYLVNEGFEQLLLKHYGLEIVISELTDNLSTLQLSESIYDQLHNMEGGVLDRIINDEKVKGQLKQFLIDFRNNGQELDNLSLIEMDYVKDYFEMKQVIFFLPSQKFLWHLDYDKIQEKEVYVTPVAIKKYFKKLSGVITSFIEEL
ncbi:hypothetical protein [Cytobacillus firmus]|uniref:Uncharacterized protein n=1 Tax=Cytobacillus firmus DS1 TaxID=1307436 RepID=W7KN16_CYTFI|nr:hypothetical protein [Cytobacillus firmus]EWG08835.1 hypothetical protein PBF_22262 [Cytobacillus firmus DS1]